MGDDARTRGKGIYAWLFPDSKNGFFFFSKKKETNKKVTFGVTQSHRAGSSRTNKLIFALAFALFFARRSPTCTKAGSPPPPHKANWIED